MQNWINFWSFLFWISILLFLSNINNFIKLLFYSELIWVILYCYSLTLGSINDDINLISFSLFILGFAGVEYAMGIIILIIFKNINKNINFNEINKIENKTEIFSKNNLFINRYIWNYNLK